MGDFQHLLMNIIGSTVTFLVPAVVWTLLVVGLYQLVCDKLRRVRVRPWGARRLMRGEYGQQAR